MITLSSLESWNHPSDPTYFPFVARGHISVFFGCYPVTSESLDCFRMKSGKIRQCCNAAYVLDRNPREVARHPDHHWSDPLSSLSNGFHHVCRPRLQDFQRNKLVYIEISWKFRILSKFAGKIVLAIRGRLYYI